MVCGGGDLALLGSGTQAETHLAAMLVARPIRRVRVWSRSQERLIEVERRAASQFFKQVLKGKDMAFLISFGAEAELLQACALSLDCPLPPLPTALAPRRRRPSRPGPSSTRDERGRSEDRPLSHQRVTEHYNG